MRSEAECDEFLQATIGQLGEDDPRCSYRLACFEACIPRTFWDVASSQIRYNRAVFDSTVVRYRKAMRRALREGFSLLFVGDNGVGKTMFISYLLTQGIKRGFTAYYTTLTRLDSDIKRGFRDSEADKRLQAMLESDFVAIDEVGKENYKQPDNFTAAQFESFLKRRYDNAEPVFLGSNVSHADLSKMYGSTVGSMLEGRYGTAILEPGDHRRGHNRQLRRALYGRKGKRS